MIKQIAKFTKPILPAFLATTILVSGCTKDQEVVEDTEIIPQKINLQQMTYYTWGTDITETDITATPQDLAEENFNKLDLSLTFGILHLYKNNMLITQMIQKINSKPGRVYNLYQFSIDFPAINPIFDSIFASRHNDFSTYGNWKSYMQAKYIKDKPYVPIVGFVNLLDTINFSLPPLVAAPLEIVNETKFPNFENEIPLWVKDGSTLKLTAVNEFTILDLYNPIIIVGNADNGFEEFQRMPRELEPGYGSPSPPIGTLSCKLTTHTHESITATQYRIDQRYDRSAHSEYRAIICANAAYTPSTSTWSGGADRGNLSKFIANVHKSAIGTYFPVDIDLFHPNLYETPECFEIASMPSPYSYNFLLGFYEKDFYVIGLKKIGKVYYGGIVQDMYVEMKFANEWYHFDPDVNYGYPFSTRHPSPNTYYLNTNKGSIELKRQYF